MIGGNNIACGISSTGTGTLSLAACPASFGAVDPDVWARNALNLGNSATVRVRYEVIEFTDSTFASPKQTESGIGVLTLGAAAGVANCTLSRDYVLEKATNLDVQPAAISLGEAGNTSGLPSASVMIIGTAANCLVMFSNDIRDAIGAMPANYWGVSPDTGYSGIAPLSTAPGYSGFSPSNGVAYFCPIWMPQTAIIKTVKFKFYSSVSSPTSSSVQAKLFDVFGRNAQGYAMGMPGKIITDFGGIGNGYDATNPAGTNGIYSITGASQALIRSGFYFLGIVVSWAGGTGSVGMANCNPLVGASPHMPQFSNAYPGALSNSGVTSLSEDPFAAVNGWLVGVSSNNPQLVFGSF